MCAGAAVAARHRPRRVRRRRPEGRRARQPVPPRRRPPAQPRAHRRRRRPRRRVRGAAQRVLRRAAPHVSLDRRRRLGQVTQGSESPPRRIADGGLPERPNGAVSKTVVSSNGHRGFKSHTLRHAERRRLGIVAAGRSPKKGSHDGSAIRRHSPCDLARAHGGGNRRGAHRPRPQRLPRTSRSRVDSVLRKSDVPSGFDRSTPIEGRPAVPEQRVQERPTRPRRTRLGVEQGGRVPHERPATRAARSSTTRSRCSRT